MSRRCRSRTEFYDIFEITTSYGVVILTFRAISAKTYSVFRIFMVEDERNSALRKVPKAQERITTEHLFVG